LFQVPANRIGSYEFSTAQLKTIQDGNNTYRVFSFFRPLLEGAATLELSGWIWTDCGWGVRDFQEVVNPRCTHWAMRQLRIADFSVRRSHTLLPASSWLTPALSDGTLLTELSSVPLMWRVTIRTGAPFLSRSLTYFQTSNERDKTAQLRPSENAKLRTFF
jgi:hypothetical protein